MENEEPFCLHLNPVCSVWNEIPLLCKRFVKSEEANAWVMKDSTVRVYLFLSNDKNDIKSYRLKRFLP